MKNSYEEICNFLLTIKKDEKIDSIPISEKLVEMKYSLLLNGNIVEEFDSEKGLLLKGDPDECLIYRFLYNLSNSNGYILTEKDINNINHMIRILLNKKQ